MQWNFTKIPKVVHFYWGGKNLSWLRYVGMWSFRKYNPDWKIILHRPLVDSKEKPTWYTGEQSSESSKESHMNEVLNISGIEVKIHSFKDLGFKENAHEIHKADFLRWKLLSDYGGLWSDNDIIYIKPMECLYENTKENSNIDTVLVPYHDGGGHTVGFMMSSIENNLFKSCFNIAKKGFNKQFYQIIGSNILNKSYNTLTSIKNIGCNPLFLNEKCVYAFPGIKEFYSANIDISAVEKAIGFHWYAGHKEMAKIELNINVDNYFNYKNTLSNILEFVLKKDVK